ncbi:diguanylate cyclase [Kineosporia succinea]|uniref:Diguanylate cyclase (GGDEF)-like protein n=1 Tax=Kineosporia succinea TaxID=84632 RepID=A0ABT9P934_9ACTN|nr:diguanylate cyclase [Kineosporia succinea]MDP9829211.1 diguanylate cyclase (GGDEF)-like protein [Kineosporia succinea]
MSPEQKVTPATGAAAVGVPVELPDFEVLGQLGGGAGSTVYRVRRRGSGDPQEYALKLLERSDALTSLRREAALLTAVDHPGLPRVHEVGVADRRPYLVMDLVQGTSLGDLLDRGAMTPERVIALVLDVIEPLAAVHARGLVHRDLKPQNVMVLPDGRARLIDFGLTAREGDDEDGDAQAPVAVGTLGYSAPEQSGMLKRPVDNRSDLYSLGVIMFEAVAGVLPFSTADVGELLRAHASLPAPLLTDLLPDVPPELAHVVDTLLAKDPDDRYQDGRALAADLRAIAGKQSPAPTADAPPMFGRQGELDTLRQQWTRVRAGSGGFAFVRSDNGLGKTRLVQEFGDLVEEGGSLVLRARVLPGENLPFAAFRQVFVNYLQQLTRLPWGERWERAARLRPVFENWSPAMLERIAPGLDAVLRQGQQRRPAPERHELPAAEDEILALLGEIDAAAEPQNDEQLGAAIATALLDLARTSGGLLLILDDVTAADASVRQVIAHLADQVRDVPMLYLGTGRDGELERVLDDSELASYIATAARVLDVDLRLEPLDEASVGAQVRSLVPGQHLPDDALAAFTTRSNGNPFIAQEYLWAVIDAGLLRPAWGTWELDLDRLDELALPQDAMGLLVNRVQKLAPHARALMVTAAAMGAQLRVDVVAAVERRSAASVLGVFTEAARQRLVEAGEEGTFRFLHGRIAEAVLETLTPSELEQLHLRIAEVLAARPPGDPARAVAHTFAIARHYLKAGSLAPPERVYAACLEAGKLALEESAAAEAVEFLEHAARLVRRRDSGTSSVLVLLGRALKQAGQFSAARRRLDQALTAETDPIARAAIHTQLAEVHRAGFRAAELEDAITQGFAATGRPLPTSTLWLLLTSVTMALASIGRRHLRPLLGDVSGEARRRALTMAGLHEAAIASAGLGMRVPEFFAHNLRSLYWAAKLGHGRRFVVAQANVGVLCAALGLNRAAERCFRRCDQDLSAQTPQTRSMLRSFRLGGAWAGNRAEGRAWRRQFDGFAPWLDFQPLIDSISVFNLGACFAGRTEEAQYWLAQGRLRLSDRTQEVTTFVTAAPMTAALLGRPVEAETELNRLNQVADEVGARQLRFIQVMAGLFVMLEDGRTGEPLDHAISDFEALRVPPGLVWRANRPVFWLIAAARLAQARACARPGTAEALKEQTLRLNQAHRAVEQLGKAANTDELKAFWAVARADLLVLQDQPHKALDVLAGLDPAPDDDMPTVAFEAARIAARALRSLNPAEGRRRARTAYGVAVAEGWPQRAASVVTEFSLPVEDRTRASGGTRRTSYAGGHERERLQALQEVSAAASRVLDPRVLARIALDETIRILAADRAFLFLVDEETGSLAQHLGRDAAGQDLATLTGYSTSLVEMVRRTGEPQVVAGTEEGAALGAESVVLHGLRSILVAPMTLDGRLLGVVYLDSQVAKGIFTTGDTVILGALTSFVASSLETARAAQLAIKAQTAERSASVAKALQQAQRRMAEPVEPLGVLNQLLHAAGREGGLLAADTAFVLRPGRSGVGNRTGVILTPDGSQPHITAFTDDGGSERLSASPVPFGGTAADAPGLLLDRFHELTSWLALPLRATDIDLGVLVLAAGEGDLRESTDLATALVAQAMTAYDRAALFERVQELAVVDELTQLANRRRFFEIATRDLEAAQRQDRPLVGMMLDIDHFKRVNDTHGHPTGDDVIAEVARRLAAEVRSTDVLGRYGGEEFAVLQQGDDPELELAERLRACVAETPVPTRTGPLDITISVGVARLERGDEDVAALLARADQGLYQAKQDGRNRVAITSR